MDLARIEDMVVQFGERLAQVAEQHGPTAVELTLAVGRIGAAQELVQGIANVLIALLAAALLRRFTPAVARAWDELDNPLLAVGGLVGGLCAGVTVLLCASSAFVKLTNIYAWIGVFRPEIYLAAKLLNL